MSALGIRWMKRTFWMGMLIAHAGASGASETESRTGPPRPKELYRYFTGATLPPNPFLANGVSTGTDVPVYTSAGTGPAGVNTAAPAGSPERFIDYDVIRVLFPDFNPTPEQRALGVLPTGMTVTEAQGLNTMERVKANLAGAGLTLEDILFMRIYLDNTPGTDRADYNGWNRAYRKHMANVDLTTGLVIASFEPVLFVNPTRPARSNLEVATLPVAGWLIEIEVTAAYRRYIECYPPLPCGVKRK